MLEEMARRAEHLAAAAMTRPMFSENQTRDRKVTHFMRYMAEYFRENLGGPMEGTLARITSIVMEQNITSAAVKRALRHAAKGGAKAP
jgi:hypothetical protein